MSELGCPRCAARLFMSSTTSITMRACGACGGVFLDNAAAARLMSLVPDDALGLADGADAHAPRRMDTAPRVACPICQKQMDRVHIKAADVEIDTCAAHGTFYDRKELVTVARACKRARVVPRVGSAAVVAGVAGVAGIAAVAAMSGQDQHARNLDPDKIDTALDVVGTAADVAVDAADVADVGGSLLEGAGDIIGGLFELLGALAD